MQTPSFGPEDEGLLVLPSEDELLEAVVENEGHHEMDGGGELKEADASEAEETGEMKKLEQSAPEPQDESHVQAGKGQILEECFCSLG